jgi:hypothetical protein
MNSKTVSSTIIGAILLGVVAAGVAISAQDRYSLKVPGGLAFAEFKGGRPFLSVTTETSSP